MGNVHNLVVDLNADMGESFGVYKMGDDENLLQWVTSANVAAGFHAGDPIWIRKTVEAAESRGVGVGAHPAYPDLNGFGRRNMSIPPEEIYSIVVYQVGAVAAFTNSQHIAHVKPHGALYNRAAADKDVAAAVVRAIARFGSEVVHTVLSGSVWEEVARDIGVRIAREGFADRAVLPTGQLAPRSMPHAVITDADAVAKRAVAMVRDGQVRATDDSLIELEVDTICVHGDSPNAVAMAKRIRETLNNENVKVQKMQDFVG